MKFLLNTHMNPAAWRALPEDERAAVRDGRGTFAHAITESGEMIMTQALADPSHSAVVRVRDGEPVVSDGPYRETAEFLSGYYLIDCDDKERAIELAARIPEARVEGFGVEVRPVMFSAGMEM
ncbi:YciI family protein [Amycolatopsis sp. NPDC059021]|uniref:YciI family protein n=1 Tax=Amycolatopsis sp. NPDC059021 TaxID=3346704 RepID=UPI00366DFCA0